MAVPPPSPRVSNDKPRRARSRTLASSALRWRLAFPGTSAERRARVARCAGSTPFLSEFSPPRACSSARRTSASWSNSLGTSGARFRRSGDVRRSNTSNPPTHQSSVSFSSSRRRPRLASEKGNASTRPPGKSVSASATPRAACLGDDASDVPAEVSRGAHIRTAAARVGVMTGRHRTRNLASS